MIRGIHHIALNTPNLSRMLEFYRDTLGFAVAYQMEWSNNDVVDSAVDLRDSTGRVVMLRAGNVYLELFEYTAPPARTAEPLRPCDHGYTHFCLDVTDIESEWQRLSASGMTYSRRPVDFGDVKAIYGKDPDGNVIEIQEIMNHNHPIEFEKLPNLTL